MPAVITVTLRLPAELGERLYSVVPAGSRNAWLVGVVEQALGGEQAARPENGSRAPNAAVRQQPPAPAEPPVFVPASTHEALVEAAKADGPVSRADAFRRASSLAKRDVRPVPKKG